MLTIGTKVNYWTVCNYTGNIKGRKYWHCRCICGVYRDVLQSQLTCNRTKSCGCRKGEDLTNKRFGHLVALEPVTRGDGVRLWRCLCDCGRETLIRANSLKQNHTTSCGCFGLEKRKTFLRKKRKKKGLAAISSYYSRYKHSAKKRKYEFSLTKEEFIGLILQPCFYCGIEPLSKIKKTNKFYSKEWTEASKIAANGIDRVDNSKGYTTDNVVTCCKICNHAKTNLTLVEFKEWFTRLCKFQKLY